MNDLIAGELEIKVEERGDEVIMSWLGKSRDRDPSTTLNPFLEEVLKSMKGDRIVLDFINFRYMNSSTVPPIINFVKQLNNSNIKTEVVYNSGSEWQTASFKALATIAKQLTNVEITGK